MKEMQERVGRNNENNILNVCKSAGGNWVFVYLHFIAKKYKITFDIPFLPWELINEEVSESSYSTLFFVPIL